MMQQFTLCAGTVIHISGMPFYLTHDTTFDGHPANVAAVSVPDQQDKAVQAGAKEQGNLRPGSCSDIEERK